MKRIVINLACATLAPLCAGAATLYVSPDGGNVAPFDTPASAARIVQDAADVAEEGDEILLAPGIYTNGGSVVTGTLTNRITVPQGVTLRSSEGAANTVIRGVRKSTTNSVRGVYLRRGARLIGVTVDQGGTRGELQGAYVSQSGGGIFCEELASVSDCIIMNSSAHNYGGGVFGGSLSNCVIVGNSALRGGGVAFSKLDACVVLGNHVSHLAAGVYRSELARCTVTDNVAGYGAGGVYETKAARSIILDNTGGWIYPNYRWGMFNYCCTDPLPDRGTSNVVSRADAEQLGYGAPEALFEIIPETARTNAPAARGRKRAARRNKAMGLEPEARQPKRPKRDAPTTEAAE